MMRRYLIRLDDACPTMNRQKWDRMEALLDKYSIKPMVGVIPHNEDEEQKIDQEEASFWEKVISWEKKGWAIALHGYSHCYTCDGGLKGLNPMWRRSEFAGLPLDAQRQKIRNGVAILKEHGVVPRYFFAPSHTFDENTLEALREESEIRIVSDTIGRFPYRYKDFWFIPQISGQCVKMPVGGVYTFCFHPNVMGDGSFEDLENFLKSHNDDFISFEEIDLNKYGEKQSFDKLLSCFFFTYRRLRKLY